MRTGGSDGDTNEGDPFVLKHASHAVEVGTDFSRPLLSTVGYLHADDFVLILKELEQSLPGQYAFWQDEEVVWRLRSLRLPHEVGQELSEYELHLLLTCCRPVNISWPNPLRIPRIFPIDLRRFSPDMARARDSTTTMCIRSPWVAPSINGHSFLS